MSYEEGSFYKELNLTDYQKYKILILLKLYTRDSFMITHFVHTDLHNGNFIISSCTNISKDDENSKIYKIDLTYKSIDFEIYINSILNFYFVKMLTKFLTIDINKVNYSILLLRESINFNKILGLIEFYYNEYKNINIKEINDVYNIKKMNKIKTKYKINISDLKLFHDKINNEKSDKIYNVPKELLFSKNQIFKLVTDEIIKFNRNLDFKHYIIPEDNNPYSLIVRYFFDNKDVKEKMSEISKKYGFDFVEIKVSINNILHPFYPIKIEYKRPKINISLLESILNIKLFNLSNWNPTISLDNILIELGKEIESNLSDNIIIDSEYNSNPEISFSEIEYNLINFSVLTNCLSKDCKEIKLNFNNLNLKNKNKNDSKYWKSGIGYGTNDRSGSNKWDIQSYIKEKDNTNNNILNNFSNIIKNIKNINDYNVVLTSSVSNYIFNFIKGANILILNKNKEIIKLIISFFKMILTGHYLCNDLSIEEFDALIYFSAKESFTETENNFIAKIISGFTDLHSEIETFLKNSELMKNIEEDLKNIYLKLSKIYNHIYLNNSKNKENEDNNEEKSLDVKEEYLLMTKVNIFGNMELTKRHSYYDKDTNNYSGKTLIRIGSEISTLKNSLPISWDTSIIVRVPEDSMTKISFAIVGPLDTPYHNGIYEFNLMFPSDYPSSPPKVLLQTTGEGTVRFNPNLYNSGKVCLSLLGTWSGDESESWTPLSTLLQVMLSIQSLILVTEPYWNEPGWEKSMNTDKGQKKCKDYTDRVRLDNILWGINNTIKSPPKEYEDFIINHFILKKDELLKVTQKWIDESENRKKKMNEARDDMIKLIDNLIENKKSNKSVNQLNLNDSVDELNPKDSVDELNPKDSDSADNQKNV